MSKQLHCAPKLIVLTSHPIQYQVPLWREIAKTKLDFEVWFLTDQGVKRSVDQGFGATFAWDVDLMSGYPHRFLELKGAWDLRKFRGIELAKSLGAQLRVAGGTALWVEGWRLKPFWDAVFAAKKIGLTVLMRGEASDKISEKGGPFGLFRKVMLHWLFTKVDYFLAIGQASRRFYLKHGVPERKLLNAPYCVDNEFFRCEAEKYRKAGTEGIRRAWNIPEDTKIVMFCGKFIPKKRPMDIIHTAQAYQTQGAAHPWHLLFVGSGELGTELRKACDVKFDVDQKCPQISNFQSPLPPRPSASFVGFLNQSEIPKAYAIADVLVLPSEAWETWGLVVNEATAAGVPTVVSDACGCSEDFAMQTSYTHVYPCGDIESLHQMIKAVLSLNMNRMIISKSVDYFSPHRTAREIMRVLS